MVIEAIKMDACYVIQGTIRVVTQLHIGSGYHFGFIKQTRDYIPGSVIRGATGTSMIKIVCTKPEYMDKHEECPVKKECPYFMLYEGEGNEASDVLFRNAYPKHKGCANKGTYLPAPRTLFTCKECDERFNTYEPPPKCTKIKEGKICEGDLKPFEGYICTGCSHITTLPFLPLFIQRLTRTAIDRRTGSVALIEVAGERFGTLHARDAIPSGTDFTLQIVLRGDAEPYIKTLTGVLEKVLPDEGLGGGKSRGLGKVSVKVEEVKKISTNDIDKRAEQIDLEDFSIRFLSNAVLDRMTLPPETLLASARRAYTWIYHGGAPSLPELQSKQQRVGTTSFSGWSLKEDKRRAIIPSIVAGSLFRYTSRDKSLQLSRSLASLEYLAIGSFKPFGLGQILVESIR
jgi:CRISPR/Cas system CSM-associated protein Csm3 (group 7 of RAMP superfamily)